MQPGRPRRAVRRRTSGLQARVLGVLVASVGLTTTSCGGQEIPEARPALRVGISPNHPPYANRVGETYAGIDVDLARDLGEWMGRPVEFVEFEWPELLTEAVQGRFDLAMSGIYITEGRQEVVDFSDPYLSVGQVAVVRCPDVERFQRISDINQEGVRFLTSRGTTTDHFAGEHLENATAVRAGLPGEVLRRLADGEGDVTFASAPRAKFAVRRDPRLCLALGGSAFGNHPVGVLFTIGSPLSPTVNRWLRQRIRDGLIAQVVQTHVEPE